MKIQNYLIILIGVIFLSVYSLGAENINDILRNEERNAAGILLNQHREQFKQIEANRRIQEEKLQNREEIKADEDKKLDENRGENLRFKLNSIIFSKKSEVLTEEELKGITSKYEGQVITVSDLYSIVNQINELYSKKGYIVCKAGLPPQTISSGKVTIILIEGKTGEIIINGNESTRESYIKKRVDLKEGKISNLTSLNKSLVWFNGSNDIQIRIQLKPGEEIGTTDYILNVYEPKQHQFSIFSDNSGSESSGEYRGGISYVNNSLFGFRDQLSVTGMFSEGTKSGAFTYTIPVTKYGTKLQLISSLNTVEIVNGDLANIDITGESSSYGVALIQPLLITNRNRIETRLEWNKQKSSTDFMDFSWVDDEIEHYSAGITITTNLDKSIIYQNHTYTRGHWTDISENTLDYGKYSFMGIFQKSCFDNNIFSVRVNAQRAFEDYLPSADQFYIGGAYSVRGFSESYMGADNGASANLEYEIPMMSGLNYFVFLDGGFVTGDNAFDDNEIASMGFGWKINFIKNMYSQVTFGFPFKNEYNAQEVDRMRVHYSISYIF